MGVKGGQHIHTMLEELAVGEWWGTKRGGTSMGHDRQGVIITAMAGCMGHNSQGHYNATDTVGHVGHDSQGVWAHGM